MDWDSDPELRRMREDFVRSLGERAEGLEAILKASGVCAWGEIRKIAHKVAGVAGSYGFPSLSRSAGALEDVLDACGDQPLDTARVQAYVSAVIEMVRSVARSGNDPVELTQDPRMIELISVAESLASEAMSGSS